MRKAPLKTVKKARVLVLNNPVKHESPVSPSMMEVYYLTLKPVRPKPKKPSKNYIPPTF